jgi:hypothetical protein
LEGGREGGMRRVSERVCEGETSRASEISLGWCVNERVHGTVINMQ